MLAAWVAGAIAEHELGESQFIPAILAGLLCLLSFHSQVSVITGLTEGLSWFLLALGFLFYLRRYAWPLAVVLALAVVQRETILIVFASLSGMALLLRGDNRRFNGFVLAWSLACCAAYVLMRTTFLPMRGPDQTNPAFILKQLRHFHFTRDLVFQGFVSLNLLWLYVAAVAFAGDDRSRRLWLPSVLGVFAVLVAVSFAEAVDNNVGRIVSILDPILAGFIATACVRLERKLG